MKVLPTGWMKFGDGNAVWTGLHSFFQIFAHFLAGLHDDLVGPVIPVYSDAGVEIV